MEVQNELRTTNLHHKTPERQRAGRGKGTPSFEIDFDGRQRGVYDELSKVSDPGKVAEELEH